MLLTGDPLTSINAYWKVKTQPLIEPITVSELKLFARIDGDDEDTLLAEIITAVRQATEEYLRRALISQTFRMVFDYWPDVNIQIPRSPLISISGVYTIGEDDTETEFSSSNYYVVTSTEPGQVVIKNGGTIPTNTDRYTAGFAIDFVAGYGALSTDVPSSILNAIKMWATMVYELRAVTTEPPPSVVEQLYPYRVLYI
jgi:uncharacterized phiE125 gp8 family phage protein